MIRSDPDNERAHFNLGFEYMEAGRKDLAFIHWEEAIRIDPSFSKAHNNLGNLYALTGDYRSATTHYEKAFSLSPEIIILPYNIARAAELMGEKEKATRYYRMFLKNAEGSPSAEHQENVRKAKEHLNILLRN
jgi:protein O-GlcNAc transferase